MLQIISEKFYQGADTFDHEGKAILYSNFHCYSSFDNNLINIEPVDIHGSSHAYLVSYINKLAKRPDGKSFLVRVGDEEIVRQFQLLCSFGLNAYFHPDKNTVELNTRSKAKNMGDQYIPSQFVHRYFDNTISGSEEDLKDFSKLLDQVIGLSREDYKYLISCLSNFFDALEVVNHNLDLAYTMLVYSLESLSKKYHNYTPQWNDYDPKVKKKLETIFKELPSDKTEEIKETLISAAHLKLQQNFIDFVITHTSNDFFISEASEIKSSLRKSEISRILKNAYATRSGYVHELLRLNKQLKMPGISASETFHWGKEPYLTFNGLVRLARHVIKNFIWSRPQITTEMIDWENDLPGMIHVELSTQFWIGKAENFTPDQAVNRFNGFLIEIQSAILTNSSITDLTDLMRKIEKLLPQAKKNDKSIMLCLYLLYNLSIPENLRLANLSKVRDKYEDVFDECTIETLITAVLVTPYLGWEYTEVSDVYNQYHIQRFSKNSLQLPRILEIALICSIGTTCHENIELRNQWYTTAMLEASGMPDIQRYLLSCISSSEVVDLNHILKTKDSH